MNRETLLKAMTERQSIEVQLSFGPVLIKPLTRTQFDHMTELAAKWKDSKLSASRGSAVRWYAISSALVDESGTPMLTKEDRDAFDSFSALDSEALFEAIVGNSAASKEDRDFLAQG